MQSSYYKFKVCSERKFKIQQSGLFHGGSAIIAYNNLKRLTLTMAMKKTSIYLFLALLFTACNNKNNTPDISHIKVNLAVDRFDQDFFSMDSSEMDKGLSALRSKYPGFLPVFLQNIVGVGDLQGAKTFYRSYKPVFDSSQKIFKNIEPIKAEIEKALRYVNYYFP